MSMPNEVSYISPGELENRLKAMVKLDEMMTPPENEWGRMFTSGAGNNFRWYIMDNGSGDNFTALFNDTGVLFKGFDHENSLSPFASGNDGSGFLKQTFKDIPESLLSLLNDEEKKGTTFCMWYLNSTGKWYRNEHPDNDGGKEYILGYIPLTPEKLYEWAKDYYDEEEDRVTRELIEGLF